MNKLNYQDLTAIDKAVKRAEIDEDAFKMMDAITSGMPEERRFQYEKVILPHANAMVKAIKELKGADADVKNYDASGDEEAPEEGSEEGTAEAAES